MSNEQKNVINSDDVTPESLMDHFQGPGLAKMVMVTFVVHLLIIVGSSVPFLKQSLMGEDVSKLTKEKRIEKAVADATASLRKIAAANGLNPQELSDTFSPKGPRAVKAASVASTGQPPTQAVAPLPEGKTPEGEAGSTPAGPESQIEKDLKKAVEGPKVPKIGEADDIF